MASTMRSTKASKCAGCGSDVKIGDPIAYYGPGHVYGLTCHSDPRAAKQLAKFLENEKGTEAAGKQMELSVKTLEILKDYAADTERLDNARMNKLCGIWGVEVKVETA